MNYILKKLSDILTVKTSKRLEEEYLSQAISLEDVERRLRNIQNKSVRDWI
jgi:hypothetical protein